MKRNPLINLLANNRGRGFFKAEATGEDSATVWLYDTIVSDDYFGGVSALAFAKELASIKAGTIHLRINTPGGDVFAGRAMEQAIREHNAKVIGHVDGYAASAGSYVALACDEVQIAPGGMFMIHKAMTIGWGNADELLATAALLEQIDNALLDTYEAETGQPREQLAAWLKAETWFTAEQAVEYGFADAIAKGADKSAKAQAKAWDFSAYRNAPAVQPEPQDDQKEAPQDTTPPVSADLSALRRRLEVAALV